MDSWAEVDNSGFGEMAVQSLLVAPACHPDAVDERPSVEADPVDRPRVRGWVLLLAGFAVLFAVLSVVIPFLHDAVQRGKRKRALTDLRTIASSVEARQARLGQVPLGHDGYIGEELTSLLVPTYLSEMPSGAVWGVPYEYYSWEDEDGSRHYQIICRGADSKPSTSPGRYRGPHGIASRCADDDIVFEDGVAIVWPEGPQDECP